MQVQLKIYLRVIFENSLKTARAFRRVQFERIFNWGHLVDNLIN